jgi:hypothetical protein
MKQALKATISWNIACDLEFMLAVKLESSWSARLHYMPSCIWLAKSVLISFNACMALACQSKMLCNVLLYISSLTNSLVRP